MMNQESSSLPNIRSGRSSTLPIHAAAVSDVGRVRNNNEDSLFLGLEEGLFIVSDGMGGHQSGEIASSIVVETLPKLLLNSLKETWARGKTINYPSLIRETVIELNDRVNRKAMQESDLRGMGATLALAWVTDARGTVFLANLGDSRAYDLRNGSLNQLTRDHSIVAILLAQGEVTAEEAALHPTRGQLYRYIGMPEEAEADVQRIHLEPGATLLLCSDGLTDELSDDRIQSIISGHEELSAACQALVDAAKESGGRDNITAMLLQWKKTGSST